MVCQGLSLWQNTWVKEAPEGRVSYFACGPVPLIHSPPFPSPCGTEHHGGRVWWGRGASPRHTRSRCNRKGSGTLQRHLPCASHLGRGTLDWGVVSVILACGQVFGLFSSVMIHVGVPVLCEQCHPWACSSGLYKRERWTRHRQRSSMVFASGPALASLDDDEHEKCKPD